MITHPDSRRLAAGIARCLPLARSWEGDVYRFAAPRWATATQLLTGEGALRSGGRWHPIGQFRAVYASLDPETALAESLAHYRRFEIALREAMPRTLNAVSVSLRRVLRLTDGDVRRRLGYSLARMCSEEWWLHQERDEEAATQALGRIAHAAGLEGLIVPSAARPMGQGLVYFPDNQHRDSTLRVVNPKSCQQCSNSLQICMQELTRFAGILTIGQVDMTIARLLWQ